jgi:hypothetical protein
MPHMSGKEVSDEMRAIRPDIKILFASAYPFEHLVESNLLNSKDTLISKPFVVSEVASAVRTALDA